MTPQEIRTSFFEAKRIIMEADDLAESVASLMDGRLRKVKSAFLLRKLKAELAQYNSHTMKWREDA